MNAATIPASFECPAERSIPSYWRDSTGQIVRGHREPYAEDVAIFHFDADLALLPYEASRPGEQSLIGLKYALQSREGRLRHKGRRCEITEAVHARLWAEIPTRPEYQRAFGGRVTIPVIQPITARVDMAAVERLERACAEAMRGAA